MVRKNVLSPVRSLCLMQRVLHFGNKAMTQNHKYRGQILLGPVLKKRNEICHDAYTSLFSPWRIWCDHSPHICYSTARQENTVNIFSCLVGYKYNEIGINTSLHKQKKHTQKRYIDVNKINSADFSPQAKFTDRAVATCRRSFCKLLWVEGVSRDERNGSLRPSISVF
jgi:hypothetical protein